MSLAILALLLAGSTGVDAFGVRVGDRSVGREEVRLRDDGFEATTSIRFRPDDPSFAYASRWTRRGAVAVWSVELDSGAGPIAVEAWHQGGAWTSEGGPDGAPVSLPIEAGAIAFPFERNLWAGFSVAARELTLRAGAGGLTVGQPLAACSALPLSVERGRLEHFGTAAFRFRNESLSLWRFELALEGGRRFGLLATADGALVRVAAVDDGIDVVRAAWDGAPPASLASSAIDRGGWKEQLSPARYSMVQDQMALVPMRDGVGLATDVSRPREPGRYPTILVRTPYFRLSEAQRGMTLVRHGYAVVVQDVRGRGKSEGAFDPLRDEVADGSDTLDWIAAQEWSDGNVGMIGASYVGWVQWLAAKSGNPHLKALVPLVAPPDPEENFPYEGGAPMLPLGWWAKVLDSLDENGLLFMLPDVDFDAIMPTLPLGDLDRALETNQKFVDDWFAHPPSDAEYWDPVRYQRDFGRLDVAVLNVSGWWDGDQPGALSNFIGMRARGPSARRGDQFLIMGAWGHGLNVARRLGKVDLGDHAVIDLDSITLRFFDRYLKGIDNGIDREPPVWVYTVGAKEWRHERDWPLPGTAFTRLHLSSGGNAQLRTGDGTLGLEPPAGGAAEDAYVCDPLDPRPLHIAWNDVLGDSVFYDQASLPDRSDVLDFRSPPLAQAIDLIGPVTAHLAVATDAEDADFAVELLRVAKDGSMVQIAGGIQRLRYRRGPTIDDPVAPNTVAWVDVDCWATGVRLEPGERLHVQVSSSNFPGYGRNLHTLEPILTAARAVTARIRILHDASHPSYVSLPVVPGEAAGPLRFE